MKFLLRAHLVLGVALALLVACDSSTAGNPGGSGGAALQNIAGSGSIMATGGAFQTGGLLDTGGTPDMVFLGTGATMAITGGVAVTGGVVDAGVTTGGIGATGGEVMGSGGTGGDGAPAFDPCPASGDCKVLPLGDSITFGSTTNVGGYRVELFSRAHMDGKHMTFVGSQMNGPALVDGVTFPQNNEGHPGWTIAQIDDIADVTQALVDSPEIVLLHIGTNDMGSMSAGASDRLDQLIDKIVAALPNSLLAVSSIIPLPWTDSTVVAYNATIPGIVQSKADLGSHVIYVEMHEGFPANGLDSDNIHPDDAVGYPWMGDTWYAAISSYLH